MLHLILALTFIGMILTPAAVAAKSGKKEFDPEVEEAAPGSKTDAAAFAAQPMKGEAGVSAITPRQISFEVSTLPLHRTLGLAGR